MHTPSRRLLTLAATLIGLVIVLGWYLSLVGHEAGAYGALWTLWAGSLVGMAVAMKDAATAVYKTAVLPAAAGTTQTAGIDLQVGAKGDFCACGVELQVVAPVLTTTELPDAATAIYDVYHDTASDFSSEALLLDNVITQTGAGGAGAATATVQVALPQGVNRYLRVKCTTSATAGDCSAKSMTARLLF